MKFRVRTFKSAFRSPRSIFVLGMLSSKPFSGVSPIFFRFSVSLMSGRGTDPSCSSTTEGNAVATLSSMVGADEAILPSKEKSATPLISSMLNSSSSKSPSSKSPLSNSNGDSLERLTGGASTATDGVTAAGGAGGSGKDVFAGGVASSVFRFRLLRFFFPPPDFAASSALALSNFPEVQRPCIVEDGTKRCFLAIDGAVEKDSTLATRTETRTPARRSDVTRLWSFLEYATIVGILTNNRTRPGETKPIQTATDSDFL